jgi:hypothetical protein
MVLGFNHNVRYKGEVFHVQTEESGLDNPWIVTLLYKGGSIIASRKTSYADILKMENLEAIVEELMKEQHKEMMRRLKSGEFDDRALSAATTSPVAVSDTVVSASVTSLLSQAPGRPSPCPPSVASAPCSPAPPVAIPKNCTSLDDAITAFFGPREK